MDKVDEDVDGHAAAGGLGTDQVELVAGTVDQHDPAATVGGVTLLGLVEHLGDDLGAGDGDRPGEPLGGGGRPPAPPPTAAAAGAAAAGAGAAGAGGSGGVDAGGRGDDIVGSAGRGSGVVDSPQGGHPLAALLFAAGQPGLVAVGALGGGLAGLVAERLGTHHHALAVDAQDQQGVVAGWHRCRGLVEG